jgi:hypothetical protein
MAHVKGYGRKITRGSTRSKMAAVSPEDREGSVYRGGRGAQRQGKAAPPVGVTMADAPRWWTVRAAQNLKPATYRCPFCHELLPALSEHMLVVPEGDSSRRRHAHSECVRAARAAGRLPLREDVEPPRRGWFRRLFG